MYKGLDGKGWAAVARLVRYRALALGLWSGGGFLELFIEKKGPARGFCRHPEKIRADICPVFQLI